MKPIEKKLNKAFRDYICVRDPVCLFMGLRGDCAGSPTECAHILSGRHDSTRWLPQNAVGLCHICHMHQHSDEPKLLEDWFKAEYNEMIWYAMFRLHNQAVRFTQDELEDHLKWLKEETGRARRG